MKLSIWTIFKSGFKLGYSTKMALDILASKLWGAQVAGGNCPHLPRSLNDFQCHQSSRLALGVRSGR